MMSPYLLSSAQMSRIIPPYRSKRDGHYERVMEKDMVAKYIETYKKDIDELYTLVTWIRDIKRGRGECLNVLEKCTLGD